MEPKTKKKTCSVATLALAVLLCVCVAGGGVLASVVLIPGSSPSISYDQPEAPDTEQDAPAIEQPPDWTDEEEQPLPSISPDDLKQVNFGSSQIRDFVNSTGLIHDLFTYVQEMGYSGEVGCTSYSASSIHPYTFCGVSQSKGGKKSLETSIFLMTLSGTSDNAVLLKFHDQGGATNSIEIMDRNGKIVLNANGTMTSHQAPSKFTRTVSYDLASSFQQNNCTTGWRDEFTKCTFLSKDKSPEAAIASCTGKGIALIGTCIAAATAWPAIIGCIGGAVVVTADCAKVMGCLSISGDDPPQVAYVDIQPSDYQCSKCLYNDQKWYSSFGAATVFSFSISDDREPQPGALRDTLCPGETDNISAVDCAGNTRQIQLSSNELLDSGSYSPWTVTMDADIASPEYGGVDLTKQVPVRQEIFGKGGLQRCWDLCDRTSGRCTGDTTTPKKETPKPKTVLELQGYYIDGYYFDLDLALKTPLEDLKLPLEVNIAKAKINIAAQTVSFSGRGNKPSETGCLYVTEEFGPWAYSLDEDRTKEAGHSVYSFRDNSATYRCEDGSYTSSNIPASGIIDFELGYFLGSVAHDQFFFRW